MEIYLLNDGDLIGPIGPDPQGNHDPSRVLHGVDIFPSQTRLAWQLEIGNVGDRGEDGGVTGRVGGRAG